MGAAPTPHSRVVSLLAQALPLVAQDHPAYAALEEAHRVAAGLDSYLDDHSSPLIVPSTHAVHEKDVRQVWEDLLAATDAEDWQKRKEEGTTTYALNSGMCSGNYEASVIQQIALAAKSTRVLEIGLFTGTTTLALGLLPNIEEVVALDVEPYLETFDRPFWKRAGVSDKIQTLIAPATDSLRQLKSEGHPAFDLVFIDADKPSYKEYVSLLLELDLLTPEGIILADNTLYKALPWADWSRPDEDARNAGSNNKSVGEATQGIIDFNQFVRNDERLTAVVLPVRDGVTVIRRKI
ncbi:O-methyltransferase-domain-containing protein [Leucosporidium creatinivorum]|uniref:O-methyltransferase-domain-containing protein n=1 Tax=Leucosporidium creatinivorum TaxID=106004 RepID=A0A1Y2G044_9BASI|nr:O-methyltransferase-domain-containing protein [Leucosporidium creatinivorum]